MISAGQASQISDDLEDLGKLRENRIFKNHILPELERMKADHRTGMRDRTLSPGERLEHVTGHEDAVSLLEFIDKLETRLRTQLKDHDTAAPIIERRWSKH